LCAFNFHGVWSSQLTFEGAVKDEHDLAAFDFVPRIAKGSKGFVLPIVHQKIAVSQVQDSENQELRQRKAKTRTRLREGATARQVGATSEDCSGVTMDGESGTK
jgi:hypothetical protein